MNGHVVDTCVLLDVFEGVETFASRSADALDRFSNGGLFIAPITYVELAPAFMGNLDDEDEFLRLLNVRLANGETLMRVKSAARHWANYVDLKRKGLTPKRPMADLLIGTCAMAYDGLITRNPKDFESLFADLSIVVP